MIHGSGYILLLITLNTNGFRLCLPSLHLHGILKIPFSQAQDIANNDCYPIPIVPKTDIFLQNESITHLTLITLWNVEGNSFWCSHIDVMIKKIWFIIFSIFHPLYDSLLSFISFYLWIYVVCSLYVVNIPKKIYFIWCNKIFEMFCVISHVIRGMGFRNISSCIFQKLWIFASIILLICKASFG